MYLVGSEEGSVYIDLNLSSEVQSSFLIDKRKQSRKRIPYVNNMIIKVGETINSTKIEGQENYTSNTMTTSLDNSTTC